MEFSPPLVPARLVSRYKRFLFDAVLEDGSAITGFCPNTGSMRGLTAPGSRIYLSTHETGTRKYRYQLELVEADGTLVGINTGLPNRLALEAIRAGVVPALASHETIKAEQRYAVQSRIDFLLTDHSGARLYVEVKNVHFSRKAGLAEFPDSPTTRGARHLDDLAAMVAEGHRAAMLYIIQRGDCERLAIAADFDPAYARAYKHARAAGVEAYAVACRVSSQQISALDLIPVDDRAMTAL
ncbi:DNA/RNA nuclease SfsA [Rhizobium sp. SG2393]|uniref:DNA/RNA nuclease SfsA n=1 Tax=Rhizobium sp. SG2393 TaxID=3276279 RepID=UPI00366E59BD